MKEILKNNKLAYIFLLVFLFVLSTGVTYAFFSLTVSGNENTKDISAEAGTLRLVYVDGVEIEGINIYPGWSQTKTFTVTNTGTFGTSYDIIFKNLINEIQQNELVVSYTCTSYKNYVSSSNKGTISGTCDSLTEQAIPLSEGTLSSIITENINIDIGITHEYTLTLLFKEMNKEQNYNQGKKVNTKINIVESSPWYERCTSSSNNLNCKMITVAESLPSSDEDINFAYTSDGLTAAIDSETGAMVPSIDETRVTNGLYYTSNLSLTEDYNNDGLGERVYYYRGAVENNNVIFGGYCWRIVRTNEDGSVKLRYNGTYANGTCPITGTDVKLLNSTTYFNEQFNNPKYNEYVFVDGSGESVIKEIIEAWYDLSGLSSYEDQIANVPYCADKSNEKNVQGEGTLYGTVNRFVNFDNMSLNTDPKPVFKCLDESGKHTVNGDKWGGTGKLSHPIGLLTADEVAYAGVPPVLASMTFYLYTSGDYWLISPSLWSDSDEGYASSFVLYSNGYLNSNTVNEQCAILPVISLRPQVTVSSTGDGSYTNPYVVTN